MNAVTTTALAGRCALIVEDDPTVADIIRRTLDLEGYETVQVATAVAQVAGGYDRVAAPGSVIVLDLVLADGDAFEVLKDLGRRRYRGGLILVSGEPGRWLEAARQTAERHGIRVLAALAKPFSVYRLRAALQQTRSGPVRPVVHQPRVDDERLAAAIHEHRIEAVFQPKVAVGDGSLRGFEALARWSDPAYGPIPPARFVAMAERLGLIGELTRNLLDRAFGETARLKARGIRAPVAVNLSGMDLSRPQLGDEVQALAEVHRLVPSDIVLEITETQVVKNYDEAEISLKRLALRGFHLSIDDFGTGHSNLARLMELPFSELKLDRSFVHGAQSRRGGRAILEGSIRLGRDLGLAVVGEGVESAADWHLLRDLGCDLAQGYFFGAPLLTSQIKGWVAARAVGA